MEEDTFGQLEEQFGSGWSCRCGGSFESANIEVVSKTKNTLLARYSCQICGRDQMVAIPISLRKAEREPPAIEVPKGTITSDDVLDIKEELVEINSAQIKNLAKSKKTTRIAIPKSVRR